jgi:hypothetical protein
MGQILPFACAARFPAAGVIEAPKMAASAGI